LGIAPRAGIKMQVTRYPLAQANTALMVADPWLRSTVTGHPPLAAAC
jgi:hypothetical protein